MRRSSTSTNIRLAKDPLAEPKYADFGVYYIATGDIPNSYAAAGDAAAYGPSSDDVPLLTIRVDTNMLRREYSEFALYQTYRDGNEWHFIPNDSAYGGNRLAATAEFWDAVWACMTADSRSAFTATGLADVFDGYVLKRMSGGGQHCDGILKVDPPIYAIEYYKDGSLLGATATSGVYLKTMTDVWAYYRNRLGIPEDAVIDGLKAIYVKNNQIYTVTLEMTSRNSDATTLNGIRYQKINEAYYLASFNATVAAGATGYYKVTYTDGVPYENIFADQTGDYVTGSKVPAFATPEKLKREGYSFQGWILDGGDGSLLTDADIAEMTVQDADLTFHAMWNLIPTSFPATVNVLLNDTQNTDIGYLMDSATKLYVSADGTTYTELTRSAQGVYTAELKNGTWYVYASADGAIYTKMDEGALVINNAASSRDLRFYTVSYDLNGGADEADFPTTYHLRGSRVDVTEKTPSKDNYIFQNWTAGSAKFTSGSLLTGGITAPYTLTATWEETIDINVKVTIHYSKGENVDYAGKDVRFALQKFDNGTVQSTALSRALTNDACPGYTYTDNTSTHVAVYTPTDITFENVPKGSYTVACTKSGYDVTVTAGEVVDGVQTIEVVLEFNPENFDLHFDVKMATGTPKSLYPRSVNVKISYWGYSGEILGWHVISQQVNTSAINVPINSETGTGSGSYPVWKYWSNSTNAYEYRIVIASYVMPDGTVVSANEATANEIYVSANNTYSGKITVENGGRKPAYPEDSNTALLGGYYNATAQNGIPTATISAKAYSVTFKADTVADATVQGVGSYTLDHQLKIPEFRNFTMQAPAGYIFEGWCTKDGTENGDWGDAVVAGTNLVEDTILYAKWKAPLKVEGTVYVAGGYTLEDGYHYINPVDRTETVRINLRKQGSSYVVATTVVSITYSETGELGSGTYAFTNLPDDGSVYYIEEAAANYSGLYRNEPESLTPSSNEEDYATGDNIAEFHNPDKIAVVDAYLPFKPASFDLKYQVDATAIGADFRPSSAEVLVTYDDGNSGIAPDGWAVISQMKFGSSYMGDVLSIADGRANGDTSVWNTLANGITAYDYGIRLDEVAGIPAAQGDAVPYSITYHAPAHWNGSRPSKLLEAVLTPKQYKITYNLGVEQTAVTGMENAPDQHTWSYSTDLTGVIPARPGFEFLGWFTDATEGSKAVTAIDGSVAKDTELFARWHQMQDIVNLTVTIKHSTDDGTTGEAGNYDKDLLVQLTRAEADSNIYRDVAGKQRTYSKEFWHVLGDDADEEVFEVERIFDGLDSEFDYNLDVRLDGYYVSSHKVVPYEIISSDNKNTGIWVYDVEVVLQYKPDLLNFSFGVEMDPNVDASLWPVSAEVKVNCWFDAPSESIELDWNTITQHYTASVTVPLGTNGKGTGSYPVWQWLNQQESIPYYYRIEVVSLTLSDGSIVMVNAPEGDGNHDVVYSGDPYRATIVTGNCRIPKDSDGTASSTALTGAYGEPSGTSYVQQGTVKAVITLNKAEVRFVSADTAMGTVTGKVNQTTILTADTNGNHSGKFTPASTEIVLTPAQEHIVFSHWTNKTGDTVDPFATELTLQGGQVVTYTANWKVNDTCTYTVRYLDSVTKEPIREAKNVSGVQYGTQITANSEMISIGTYVFDYASADSITVGLNPADNVLTLYYAKDQWNDETDSNTDGDEIPDYKQVLIHFTTGANGTVSGKTKQVITLTQTDEDGKYTGTVTPEAVTIAPNTHYTFDRWTLNPGAKEMFNENDPYTEANRLEAEGGSEYTYHVTWKLRQYNYTIRYLEQGSNVELAPSESGTATYDPENPTTVTRKEITGYQKVEGDPDELTVEYRDNQEITFYYVKKIYELTVNFVDIDTGDVIHQPVVVRDFPYLSEPDIPVLQKLATIPGYTYVESDPENLVIQDIGNNTITLKYRINQYRLTVYYFYDNVLDEGKTAITTTTYRYGTLISDVWKHEGDNVKSGEDYVLYNITGTDSTISDHTDVNAVYVYYVKDVLKDNSVTPDPDGTGDRIPDMYQATVTYEVVNGTWEDGTATPHRHVFTLSQKTSNGEWVKLTGEDVPVLGNTVPTGKPNDGFEDTPVWSPVTPDASTVVTGDATYVLAYSKPNTHNITVTVVNGSVEVDGTSRSEDHFTITVNDENFSTDDTDSTTLKFAPDADHILWSVTADNKAADLTDSSYSFDHDKDHSIEVVYELDKVGDKDEDGEDIGDGIPDRFQKKITYRIINGTWNGSDNADKVAYVSLKKDGKFDVNGTATISDPYPAKVPNAGYTSNGSWEDGTGTPVSFSRTVSGTNDELFIFSYEEKIPVTVTIEVIGGTSLPVASVTVYEYSTDTTTIQFSPLTDHSLVSAQVKLGTADWTDISGFADDYTHDYTQNVHIKVVYKLDKWDDKGDKETGGDKIPDEQQALVKFVSADLNKGTVGNTGESTTQVYTMGAGNALSTQFSTVTAVPVNGYRFSHWVDHNGNTYTTKALFESTHNLQGGKTYVFTAIFTEESYSYTVKYYFDGEMDETKTKVESADYNSQITLNPANRAGQDGEYLLERVDPESKTITISYEESRNVFNVYYVTDKWNDVNDSETGGDDIPDKKQALVKFVSAGNGSVGGDTVQIFTMSEAGPNIYTPSSDVTTTAETGYVFSHWKNAAGRNVDPFQPSRLTGGQELVYTAVFEKDKFNYTVEYYYDGILDADKTKTAEAFFQAVIDLPAQPERDGDYVRESAGPAQITIDADESKNVFKVYYVTDKWNDVNDSETGGDNVPDKYQALVKFTSADADKGTVTGNVVQVITFPGNATSGNVTASLANVVTEGKTVEGVPYAFDYWTRDILPAIVNPEDTLGDVPGGTVITFYAHFAKDAYRDGDQSDPEVPDAPTGGDGIPDYYQAKVIYQVANGTWDGTATNDIVEVFTLYKWNTNTCKWDKIPVTLGDTVPVGMQPNTGYQNPGTWDAPAPTAATEVTGDTVYVYRYGEDARIVYKITVTVVNGTADPADSPISVYYGENQTITFAPDSGYALDSVTVDDAPAQLTDGKYTFETVLANHKIHVVYALDSWKDSEQTTDTTDTDGETGGDGIPDYRQAVVKFVSADPLEGSIEGTSLYVMTLLEKDEYTGTFTADEDAVKAVPTTGYKLDHWELTRETRSRAAGNTAVDPYSALVVTGGGLYTYTANFTERIYIQVDPNGGTWNNSTEIQKCEIDDPDNSEPDTAPVRAGYIFDGWTRTDGAADSDVVYIYTAEWKADYKDVDYPEADPDDDKPDDEEVRVQATKYIEIRPNGGVWHGSAENQKVQITGDYTLADPSRTGYIFMGWVRTNGTEENVIYVFTAQWEIDVVGGKDADGDDIGDEIPDKYQKKVIFKVMGGYWKNESRLARLLGQTGNDKDIVVWLTLVDAAGNWSVNGSAVLTAPTGMYAKSGYYSNTGKWDITPPAAVTGTDTEVYTYRFTKIPTTTPQTGDTIGIFAILFIFSGGCLTIILINSISKRRKDKK